MICDNILEAIGHTPVIRLNRMGDPDGAEILVKFEGLNVGGSIKTRTAYNMICDAEAKGLLHKDSIIVEPTSGNQGIGLPPVPMPEQNPWISPATCSMISNAVWCLCAKGLAGFSN